MVYGIRELISKTVLESRTEVKQCLLMCILETFHQKREVVNAKFLIYCCCCCFAVPTRYTHC